MLVQYPLVKGGAQTDNTVCMSKVNPLSKSLKYLMHIK